MAADHASRETLILNPGAVISSRAGGFSFEILKQHWNFNMKLKLTAVYAAIIAFNIVYCVVVYASQWVPIVSLSLHPQINECGGLRTFSDVEFLRLFFVQVALSIGLHVSGIWLVTNSFRHFQSFWIGAVLALLPSLIALTVLKLEPFFVRCIT